MMKSGTGKKRSNMYSICSIFILLIMMVSCDQQQPSQQLDESTSSSSWNTSTTTLSNTTLWQMFMNSAEPITASFLGRISSSSSSSTSTPPPPTPTAPPVYLGTSDPDSTMSLEQLIHSRGFRLEAHTVATADGYLLTIHRLIHVSSTKYDATKRKPVIIQHGLFGSSTDFLINSPHLRSNRSKCGDNFAFGLALTGRYDVWLPNMRGNEYSQQHLHYRRNVHTNQMEQLEYWNFSFDQMALYDLPVIIDHVRTVTGAPRVAYVGYSQGTSVMFALLSLRPEMATVIHPFIAWAPVVYLRSIRSPFRYLAPMANVFRLVGNRFSPSTQTLSALSHPLCKLQMIDRICANALFLFGGFDYKHLNRTRLPVYFHFTPATVSTWQVAHYLQLINSGRFARFAYDNVERNKEAYGQVDAPDYPLHRIPADMTIVLVRAENDYLSSMSDTEELIRVLHQRDEMMMKSRRRRKRRKRMSSDDNEDEDEDDDDEEEEDDDDEDEDDDITTTTTTASSNSMAQSTLHDYIIPDSVWSHLDYTLGMDAGRMVYDKTIEYLDKFVWNM